jgi:hypothetical protein
VDHTNCLQVAIKTHSFTETPSLMSYILRYVSFAEVHSVCRVAWREPMNLCTCMREEVSYILRYGSFAEVGRVNAISDVVHTSESVSQR